MQRTKFTTTLDTEVIKYLKHRAIEENTDANILIECLIDQERLNPTMILKLSTVLSVDENETPVYGLDDGKKPEIGMTVYPVETTINLGKPAKTYSHVYSEIQWTNKTPKPLLKGWLGETDNRSRYAMGTFTVTSIRGDRLTLKEIK